ncbi:NUDIX hydrolase [Alkalibacter rhizosphaerae]|uniref:NUDIX hydrolase n=1 Tax=Alkalibacter rhizosphaerae TaxID=2815577 RepID=A0A974XFI6_9FIRM|nr:NUDIX hydrolase [Alkalibacter rhizosphaerae]QSX08912.1 NUDIX hydrolase [Alkalibacter rhizosphaerae]
MFREETISSEIKYKGIIVDLHIKDVRLPNGKMAKREIVTHPGASAVLALDEGELILIRQFRKPVETELLEIPAGKLDPGEDPKDCAFRELEEETGYRALSMEKVGLIHTSPGFSNEVIHLYFTDDLIEGTLNRDEDEFMGVERIPLKELSSYLVEGKITDAKTLAALSFCQDRLSGSKKGGDQE